MDEINQKWAEDKDQFNMPKDFDLKGEIIVFQYAQMLKFRGYEKRLLQEEMRLDKFLKEHFREAKYIEKIKRKIYLQAYNTIPGEFWKNIKI